MFGRARLVDDRIGGYCVWPNKSIWLRSLVKAEELRLFSSALARAAS